MLPVGILTLMLAAPTEPVPQLRAQRGDEWTFRGSVAEQVQRLDVRFRRKHDLEVRVFTLDAKAEHTDFAVLTMLRRADDLVSEAVPIVSGTADRDVPPAVRLDLVRLYGNGSVALLLPSATLPLVRNEQTPVTMLPGVPLESFSPFEFGVLPPRGWTAGTAEFVTGERCVPVHQTRQSPNWADPVGGKTAVQIAESTWLSTRDGSVRRHHRRIEHRDGFRTVPAVTIETKLEAESQTRVIGRDFDRYAREIEFAYAHGTELAGLLPNAVKLGSRPFEAKMLVVDEYLDRQRPGTPYREAVLSVRRRLDSARSGEAAPALSPTHRFDAGGTASPVRPPVVRATVGP